MLKKTKIVCTIGPASIQTETLKQMFRAGMSCARINTAYGDFDHYLAVVENVREVADVPVLIDLKGPEIRLKTDKDAVVNRGDILEVGFNDEPVSFNHNFTLFLARQADISDTFNSDQFIPDIVFSYFPQLIHIPDPVIL